MHRRDMLKLMLGAAACSVLPRRLLAGENWQLTDAQWKERLSPEAYAVL
ncbi:MAG: peptide-methionine (R)-S-oxide reductase, partial [Alphaproteobacteria bacterium]|nr:peptide-methionine (R)-S-oxide reductase [Alphaproteobacteria bacterium]